MFEQAKQIRQPSETAPRQKLLEDAAKQYDKTLKIDSENVAAHYGLRQIHTELKSIAEKSLDQTSADKHDQLAKEHGRLHERYKPDDNARDLAQQKAKVKYPWAAKASEPIVIYSLNRPGAPGLVEVGRAAEEEAVTDRK